MAHLVKKERVNVWHREETIKNLWIIQKENIELGMQRIFCGTLKSYKTAIKYNLLFNRIFSVSKPLNGINCRYFYTPTVFKIPSPCQFIILEWLFELPWWRKCGHLWKTLSRRGRRTCARLERDWPIWNRRATFQIYFIIFIFRTTHLTLASWVQEPWSSGNWRLVCKRLWVRNLALDTGWKFS